MRKTFQILREDSGAALMMAIFTVTMLMVIAIEIMYETNVELAVSAQTVNQVRAHYAAKAGVEMSLLRLHIYRKVMGMLGDAGKQMSLLDMIWQMPFSWPPLVPEGTSGVDKDEIKSAVKNSTMQGQYVSTIESESSKIDLSLLALSGESTQLVVKSTLAQLQQIFETKMRDDEEFARKHSGEDFTKIVNNIKDWVDEDDKGTNGDESSLYPDMKSSANQTWPPNQPFKTFAELHMVAGVTDEFYKLLLPRVTIFGAKAVNVKYAPKEVLQALFKLTEEQANRVLEERAKKETTSFKDPETFMQYLQSVGVRIEEFYNQEKKLTIPILVEPEFNFRIKSNGLSGKVNREITAIVYDYDRVLDQMRKLKPPGSPTPPQATPTPLPDGTFPKTTGPSPAASPSQSQPKAVPNERPNIVYWNET